MSRIVITSYRVTPDDLPGLNDQERRGLRPLLNALNITVPQLTQAVGLIPDEWSTDLVFATNGSGAATVDLTPGTKNQPTAVLVDRVFRSDGTIPTAVWAFQWTWVGNGVRLYFLGLDVSSSYNLSVTVR